MLHPHWMDRDPARSQGRRDGPGRGGAREMGARKKAKKVLKPPPPRFSYCGFFEVAGKYSCICGTVSFRASESPSSTLKIGT
jgi:hypothetical protein